jgi:hypothetical protein
MRVVVKGPSLEDIAKTVTTEVQHQMERRSYLAANELRNSALLVLRGQRSGRRYKIPGTHRRQRDKATGKMKNGRYYTASAPGEPPAVRTGTYRNSWQPVAQKVFGSYISRIESDVRTDNGRHNLGEILENGSKRMAPRPHHDKILEKAEPKIVRIYEQPYF